MKAILLSGFSVLAALAVMGPDPVQLAPNSERMAPMVLSGYTGYPRNIGKAVVYDLDGHQVGSVEKLGAGPAGKPSEIQIWLPSGRTFTVAASNVSYDEQANMLTVGLTDTQLGVGRQPTVKQQ